MENQARTNHRVRFKAFELDLGTRQLYRNGIRLRVLGQPIDVLEMLLERPGDLVTREQLRKKLWPQDTFVDFEHSLNSAVMRLRDALGDRADDPKYIETLPRLGYRFVGVVQAESDRIAGIQPFELPPAEVRQLADVVPISTRTEGAREAPPEADPAHRESSGLWRIVAVTTCVVVLSAGALLWHAARHYQPPHLSRMTRLTTDVGHAGKLVLGTDGSRVFLKLPWNPPTLGTLPASGGEISTTTISLPELTRLGAVSPDGNSLIVYGKYDPTDNMSNLWIAGTSGSSARLLARVFFSGASASWSPDGKEIIYSTSNGGVYTVSVSGGEPHLLCTLGGEGLLFAYSPDGSRIRFTYANEKARSTWRIWEMSSKGEDLHEVFPNFYPSADVWNGRWTSDGRFYVFLVAPSGLRVQFAASPSELWVSDERRGLFRRGTAQPIQLVPGHPTWSNPHPSPDGRTIFAEGIEFRGELMRFNLQTKRLERYLGGISAEMLDFSRDGRSVIYDSFPDGTLWLANRDGRFIQRSAKAPYLYPVNPRISPDGNQIAFVDFPNRQRTVLHSSIYIANTAGGTATQLLPGDAGNEYDPTWSPDGKRLAFGRRNYWETSFIDPSAEVGIVDLATRAITYLPAAPTRVRMPRWSPEGRYIVCMTVPESLKPADGLAVYDFASERWTVIVRAHSAEWPAWSADGRWIYYVEFKEGDRYAFYRTRPEGGTPELIADLGQFNGTGFLWGWFGFDPEGNPLMLRDAGTDEVYALTVEG